MKNLLIVTTLVLSSTAIAQRDNIITVSDQYGNEVKCNWGRLTSSTIVEDGFDQGGHASSQTNPRAGLANVVNRGDLQALCKLIQDSLP